MATRKKATKKAAGKKRATGAARRKSAKRKAPKKKGTSFRLLDLLRNPLLASVGAFALAEEGLERLVGELIDRGEATEREGRKLVDEYRTRATKTRKELEKNIDNRIADALQSFRLPTKKDLDALNRKLNALERRVDKLIVQRAKSG